MITQTHRPLRTHPKTPPKSAGPREKHCELAGRRGHPRKGRREQRTYTHRDALDRDITGAANKINPCFVARSVRSNSKLTKRARALHYSGQMPPTKSIRCRLRGQRCKCIHDHTCIGRLSVFPYGLERLCKIVHVLLNNVHVQNFQKKMGNLLVSWMVFYPDMMDEDFRRKKNTQIHSGLREKF